MKTIEEIQTAIAKGKIVVIKGHNMGTPVTFFKVWRNMITIEAGNVRRFKIGALDHFLRHAIRY
jgi:hypothetical protein